MLTVKLGERYPALCALVLGGFDGLHLAHRRLLECAAESGLPVVATTMFGFKGKRLFTRDERRHLFESAGVDALCEIELTEGVRMLSAEDFLHALFAAIPARLAVCGEDFRFGRGAAGTPELLGRLAPCPVEAIPVIRSDAVCPEEPAHAGKLSTSACKELLRQGRLAALNAHLCSSASDFYKFAYFVQGTVEHGREVGRTYGFPTLNLTVPPEKLLPPDGVYGGLAATPEGNYPCILNLGPCPTFGVGEKKLEAHLDGFSGDLYGKTVRVYPKEFYRGIVDFGSAAALEKQLEADLTRLRNSHI